MSDAHLLRSSPHHFLIFSYAHILICYRPQLMLNLLAMFPSTMCLTWVGGDGCDHGGGNSTSPISAFNATIC